MEGIFCGKKERSLEFGSFVYFLDSVEEEKPFRDGSLAVQKLKYSFVYNLWSWNRLYLGKEACTLLGFWSGCPLFEGW